MTLFQANPSEQRYPSSLSMTRSLKCGNEMRNKKIYRFQWTIVFLSALFSLCSVPSRAEPNHSQCEQLVVSPPGIFYGPALILNCNEMILQADSTIRERENKTLKLSEGDHSFSLAQNWLGKNILTPLNKSSFEPDLTAHHALHLFCDRKNGMMGLMISIPLGREILGPDYSIKLDELRTLMDSGSQQP